MLSYSLNVSIIQLFLEGWGAPSGPFVYDDGCCASDRLEMIREPRDSHQRVTSYMGTPLGVLNT